MQPSSIVHETAPLILAEIQKAKSILLHCHPSPDPDSVGSALAMKFALEQMGKKATVIRGDSEIPQAFMHFPGANEIVAKNYFEVDLKEFDLFIIVDTGGIGMVSGKGKVIFPENLNTIVIDHHFSNDGFGKINLVDKSSPAAAFVIFQLFMEWHVEITREIAMNLIMGMYSDTGGFKYDLTDYRLLEAVAYCAKIAPDYTKSVFIFENSEKKEDIYFKAMALSSIETFCDDHLVISSVSFDELQSKKIPNEAISECSISNALKAVVGWDIAVQMTEREPGSVKMSFRTRDSSKYDLSKLAGAMGGGGHRAAAAARANTTLEEAKKQVVAKAKELYNL